MSTDSLINYEAIKSATIQDSVGNSYGSVSDIIINRSSGVIEFLIVGHGGVLGIGRDFFTIPFQSVDIAPNTGKIIMNVTKEKIENAPRFENDNVSKWGEQERSKMLKYYGVSDHRSSGNSSNIDDREHSLADKNHQSYEGSSQVTNQAPDKSQPAKDVNYDKMKGTE